MRKDDDPTTFIVPKVEKIRSLNVRIPKGLFRPVAGKLYLYFYLLFFTVVMFVEMRESRIQAVMY